MDIIWNGVLDELPPELLQLYESNRGDALSITWAAWWTNGGWMEGTVELPKGNDPDGRAWLCSEIPRTAADFVARSYDPIPMSVVDRIFSLTPLTEELIT